MLVQYYTYIAEDFGPRESILNHIVIDIIKTKFYTFCSNQKTV